MFGFFFPNKVAHHMFRLGYSVHDMPPSNIFSPICKALRSSGYDAERAADLWVRCLVHNDKEAIRELYKSSGAYGVMLFGNLE